MKTAVAAPADDGRERFLSALRALLIERLRQDQHNWRMFLLTRREPMSTYREPPDPYAGGREP